MRDQYHSVVISPVDYEDTHSMLKDLILEEASLDEDDASSPFERYGLWLASATSDEWHFAAQSWNVDLGWVPIFWIIRQPLCEIATAAEVFYRSLSYDVQSLLDAIHGRFTQERERDDMKLLCEIHRRLMAGFYSRGSIVFDGAEKVQERFGPRANSPEVLEAIPAVMRQNVGTRTPLDTAGPWGGGFPEALWRGRE